MPKIIVSIIIPVFNEAEQIGRLVEALRDLIPDERPVEILVVDGGSEDRTVQIASGLQGVIVLRSERGRAIQMNRAAKQAKGDYLYFLHADTTPPEGFLDSIIYSGSDAGCFRMRFGDSNSPWLSGATYFTRFQGRFFRGGDQSMFVKKDLFVRVGGFDSRYEVYEDVEFILRLKRAARFIILKDYVETSARLFRKNGVLRLYYHFFIIHMMAILKYPPKRLSGYYKGNIVK
ncbi:MAG: TIGR04283 family arsenosugar biosynthesis glycosyltransferase [Flavobacteriales bacterium]|nr:TIGR04283 family arsenosugar biosynthesis glycosyltransferase [Flavobacteriales bacterium]